MNKIIFLDIDGVLNTTKTYEETHGVRKIYNKLIKENNDLDLMIKLQLLEIDYNKLIILKEIINKTNAKIVITSSWRLLRIYPLIEDYLIKFGLPIIGTTKKLKNRGEEIADYCNENNVKNYIIIDDEVFEDFTENQKYN